MQYHRRIRDSITNWVYGLLGNILRLVYSIQPSINPTQPNPYFVTSNLVSLIKHKNIGMFIYKKTLYNRFSTLNSTQLVPCSNTSR